MDLGEGRPRLGERRVLARGPLEHLDGQLHVLVVVAAATVLLSPDVEVVGLQVVGGALGDPGLLLRGELGLERPGDPTGQLALDLEDVLGAQPPVVGLGPEVFVGGGVDELGVHPDPVAGPLHAALHHGGHAQLGGDLPHALGRVPVLQDRGPGDHLQGLDLGELGEEVVVDAVGEGADLVVAGEVVEGEDGHRRLLRPGVASHRRRRLADEHPPGRHHPPEGESED
ncbi:MAG: hypothetical protein GWM92_05320, partial [Gemmatimonadetes bacterium]|nr:hypothetical protein [Gemmatimonadota bacterium]NIR78561.1 hypothetical protein [Gemmatimonadota bacterium]NIT86562.1 hypothetical protein [Gemmatimonadota bacterium]NIU31015.1 hypothetical protein [Gemmatimonadota bacterium]NIU35769.1 hypothetical protein [Gemmatimonadota bacterium]